MFGLFKPKLPLSVTEKAWVEQRLADFVRRIGFRRFVETPTLLPNDPQIPTVTNYDEAVDLLKFVGHWTNTDIEHIRLQVYGETLSPDQVGSYEEQESTIIQIHEVQNRDELISTMAWQLARQELLANPVVGVELSPTWSIDLLPVVWGLGIFAANASWGASQAQYLPSRAFAYAMSVRERLMGNTPAAWTDLLREDARGGMEESTKYLSKTSDCSLTKDNLSSPREIRDANGISEVLRTGTPSSKVLALWELNSEQYLESQGGTQELIDRVKDSVRDRLPDIRSAAISALPNFDRSVDAAQDIADALKDQKEAVRFAAATAMPAFVGTSDEAFVEELATVLQDSSRSVVFAVANALTFFGDASGKAVPRLLKRFRQALVNCREEDSMVLLRSICLIVGDPREHFAQFFDEHNEEYHDAALELLAELEEAPGASNDASPE